MGPKKPPEATSLSWGSSYGGVALQANPIFKVSMLKNRWSTKTWLSTKLGLHTKRCKVNDDHLRTKSSNRIRCEYPYEQRPDTPWSVWDKRLPTELYPILQKPAWLSRCVRACVCVCACVRACVHVCVYWEMYCNRPPSVFLLFQGLPCSEVEEPLFLDWTGLGSSNRWDECNGQSVGFQSAFLTSVPSVNSRVVCIIICTSQQIQDC